MKLTALTQLIMCIAMFLSTTILAQNSDASGSKDHPLITRLPDFYIAEYKENEFAQERFNTEAGTVPVEGHQYKIDYRLKEGATPGGKLQRSPSRRRSEQRADR